MEKNFRFDINDQAKVKDEIVSGLLFDVRPIKTDDTVAPIADLNKISIDVILKRAVGSEKILFSGYMEDYLLGLYSQTPKLELVKQARSYGYLLLVDFSPAAVQVMGDDELIVKLRAQKTAFTGTVEAKSSITMYTQRGTSASKFIPMVDSFPIGKDEEKIDMDLGDGITKITIATDFQNDYLSSTNAKIENGTIRAAGNYERAFTEPQLLAENIHYLDMNPDSAVQDLVGYWGEPLNRTKLRAKLTKGAAQDAKVITVAAIPAY